MGYGHILKNARKYDRNRYQEKRRKGLCVYHGCGKRAVNSLSCCKNHHQYFKQARKKSEWLRKNRERILLAQL